MLVRVVLSRLIFINAANRTTVTIADVCTNKLLRQRISSISTVIEILMQAVLQGLVGIRFKRDH